MEVLVRPRWQNGLLLSPTGSIIFSQLLVVISWWKLVLLPPLHNIGLMTNKSPVVILNKPYICSWVYVVEWTLKFFPCQTCYFHWFSFPYFMRKIQHFEDKEWWNTNNMHWRYLFMNKEKEVVKLNGDCWDFGNNMYVICP